MLTSVCTDTYSLSKKKIWAGLQNWESSYAVWMELIGTCDCTRWSQNVRGKIWIWTLSALVCEHSQCIASVHMCDATNRKKEDGRYLFWQRAEYPFIIHLALCAWFGDQKQPTVETKLLPALTAMIVILKSFHKSLFLDDSLAAVQLFRKCIVPFPVWHFDWSWGSD